MKNPAFQFYPGDWKKDQDLSRASLAAKGALIEIMCLAFECEKRGVLQTGKHPWTIEEIAFAMGGDKKINIAAIEELLSLNVIRKDKKGAIYQNRIIKDEKLRKTRREAGSKGGNPILVKGKVKTQVNQNPTPSSSSSSSTSVVGEDATKKIWNVYKFIKENSIQFERIVMTSYKPLETVEASLLKYHLYMESKEKYPISEKQAFSGFRLWLMNENGNAQAVEPKKKLVV